MCVHEHQAFLCILSCQAPTCYTIEIQSPNLHNCFEKPSQPDMSPRSDTYPTPTVDPDCAICSAPAHQKCSCEASGLDAAVRQAESKFLTSHFQSIREWVRLRAQDYILNYYELLIKRRREAHEAHLRGLEERAMYYWGSRPHPEELRQAMESLKRGCDEDWKGAVQRYPEVLEYYFSLVQFQLPPDDALEVRDPPLSALAGVGARVYREPPIKRRESGRGDRRSVPPERPRAPKSGYSYNSGY